MLNPKQFAPEIINTIIDWCGQCQNYDITITNKLLVLKDSIHPKRYKEWEIDVNDLKHTGNLLYDKLLHICRNTHHITMGIHGMDWVHIILIYKH